MNGNAPTIVLVTGTNGFLGRHAARRFSASGARVVGLGHGAFAEGEARKWGISHWQSGAVSLATLDALELVPDVIVHCAGGALVSRSFADPHADFQMTVDATSSVLEFMRRRAPNARLVYPSTAAVYGLAQQLPIPIHAPVRPLSPYGVHKAIAESLCRSYAAHFGMRIAVVRLFSVYGPGLRKQLLWDACRRLETGTGRFAGTGTELRDWLHVEDAVRLFEVAARVATELCPTANGGTGEGTSVSQILHRLGALVSAQTAIEFEGTVRAGDPPAYVADLAAVAGWGWAPAVGWRDGVDDYAQWYLSSMRGGQNG